LQPEVTPLWICAPVGAGVWKAVPGAVRVADAASSPVGVLARWQFSQLVDEGMCDPAPTGFVGGMTTMRPMPTNATVVPEATWHETQLLTIPAWFISEPANRAPSTTGNAAIEDPGPTWQTSHEAVVGRWLAGNPTMLKPACGMANEAAAAPWHWAQLTLVLGAQAWMLASVGITA
jgi:hypothetical protein